MFIYERDGKTVVSWHGGTLSEILHVVQEYFSSVPPERIRVTPEISNDGHDLYPHIVLSEV